MLAVTVVSVITAIKIHAALFLPWMAVVAGIALAIGHDFDATFFGLASGLVVAIPLAGSGRRKQDFRTACGGEVNDERKKEERKGTEIILRNRLNNTGDRKDFELFCQSR